MVGAAQGKGGAAHISKISNDRDLLIALCPPTTLIPHLSHHLVYLEINIKISNVCVWGGF
jgi:hypothetical protein